MVIESRGRNLHTYCQRLWRLQAIPLVSDDSKACRLCQILRFEWWRCGHVVGHCGVSAVDLATIDKPIGDFLSLSGDIWPIDDAMMTKYRLTDEQLAQYDRDG